MASTFQRLPYDVTTPLHPNDSNPVQHSKTKHIDICHHCIRDIVQKVKMELFYIPSTDQLANLFSMTLDEKTLNILIVDLGMFSMT